MAPHRPPRLAAKLLSLLISRELHEEISGDLAEEFHIGWWITSALESNIGLNAIAQWTYTLNNKLPQGLGTGGLFTNNFDSPLVVKNGTLRYNNKLNWDISNLKLKH